MEFRLEYLVAALFSYMFHMPQKSSRNRIRTPMEIKLVKNKNISFSDSLQSPIPLRTSSPICQNSVEDVGLTGKTCRESEKKNRRERKQFWREVSSFSAPI
ncbi:uncharacterized protein LOC117921506 [Vitis riparia]|uniref:uncharacterized protein LOC117921506 n=1 Tax=Vitis riparia TaxID=96939 RepID=UPI00155B2A16|nr:uncharacterized protein LOC117921506 [Vitis riparia]